MIRNDDNDRLAARGRTSISRSSVLNLGNNPRVVGQYDDDLRQMPRLRRPRNYRPGHARVLSLLEKCVPLRNRKCVRRRFRAAMERPKKPDDQCIRGTPVRWIEDALRENCYRVTQLRSLDELYPRPGVHDHLSEFFLLDVVLNRARPPQGEAVAHLAERDPDAVALASAYNDSDFEDRKDPEYCAVLAFLPGAGVFYCHRERRKAETGFENSFVQLDMSWLRLARETSESATGRDRLSFGPGGYVKRLCTDSSADGGFVSAWKVSRSFYIQQLSRRVYWGTQCSDADGPMMPPDYIGGQDIGKWYLADRGQAYNDRLAKSNSVRVGGRHYAPGCLHYSLPSDCFVIDGAVDPAVDIIVDIAPVGNCTCRKSIVMVRQILSPTQMPLCEGEAKRPLMVEDLGFITLHNSLLRTRVPTGTARAGCGDLGSMHPIGTRILLDGVTTADYAANSKVPQRFLRKFFESLADIGANCFPDVLAVMQDVEGDTGLQPVATMVGKGSENRVAYSADMSVDLGNASHYDVGDVSQGFSVWTEEVPGLAANWFFVMPNVHGITDGTPFNGVAVKLYHGTSISWDGRVIRHCTSVTIPVGLKKQEGAEPPPKNHVYGTFSAAKERIVNAGRRRAAAAAAAGCPVTPACDDVIAPAGMVAVGAAEAFARDDDEDCNDNDDEKNDEIPWWDRVLPPYNPRIEDADPDWHPPPRDGSQIDWLRFYARKRDLDRPLVPDVAAAAEDDSSLFSRDSSDGNGGMGMDDVAGDGHGNILDDVLDMDIVGDGGRVRRVISGDNQRETSSDPVTADMLLQGDYKVPRTKRPRH